MNIVYKEAGVQKKMSTDLVLGAFGLNTAPIKRIVGKNSVPGTRIPFGHVMQNFTWVVPISRTL